MRAAQYYAARDVRVEDIPRPEASKDKILIAVEWCGICGSDMNEYARGPFAIPNPKIGPHPLTNALLPITLGHEFSGRILEATSPLSSQTQVQKSANGHPLLNGQAVVIDPRFYCTHCAPCTASATNNCHTLGFQGLSGGGGGFSEIVAVDPDHIFVLPEFFPGEEIDLAAAALIEPLAVAWHGLRLFLEILPIQTGMPDKKDLSDVPVLVIGAGPVGIAMIHVVKAHGARTILVSEVSKARRELLVQNGIVSEVFDPVNDDIPGRCKEATGGLGVAGVFDCAGAQAGFDAGCEGLKFRGGYVNLALPKEAITLPIIAFLFKEITYKCSLAYDEKDFGETVDAFVQGRFKGVEKMITRRLSLEDVVEKGFEELLKPNEHIKILASPKVNIST